MRRGRHFAALATGRPWVADFPSRRQSSAPFSRFCVPPWPGEGRRWPIPRQGGKSLVQVRGSCVAGPGTFRCWSGAVVLRVRKNERTCAIGRAERPICVPRPDKIADLPHNSPGPETEMSGTCGTTRLQHYTSPRVGKEESGLCRFFSQPERYCDRLPAFAWRPRVRGNCTFSSQSLLVSNFWGAVHPTQRP